MENLLNFALGLFIVFGIYSIIKSMRAINKLTKEFKEFKTAQELFNQELEIRKTYFKK